MNGVVSQNPTAMFVAEKQSVTRLGSTTDITKKRMNQEKSRVSGWAALRISALFCVLSATAQAQTLTITGEVKKPLTIQAADLKTMTRAEVTGKDHDGNEHRYTGVLLADLLKQAGATMGSELRGKNLRKYVVVQAADGYEAVYALPEIDPEFTSQTIILADSVDGKPLAAGVGPYQVIVPGDKKMARWVRRVTTIDVRVAN